MSLPYLRAVLLLITALVFLRHVNGARATFTRLDTRTRFTPAVIVMMLAMAVALLQVGFAEINPPLVPLAFAGFIGSFVLFEWARRSIRGRTFTVFFSNDVPQFVWTGGPYAYVRHPFYASYLLAFASVAVALRSWISLAVFGVMIAFFWTAARREERKFVDSPMATEYAAYMRRTGRFIPRLISAAP